MTHERRTRRKRKIYITICNTFAYKITLICNSVVTRNIECKKIYTFENVQNARNDFYIAVYAVWYLMVYLYNRVISWQQPNKKFRLESICNPAIVIIIIFCYRRVVLAWQTNSGVRLSSVLFKKKMLTLSVRINQT